MVKSLMILMLGVLTAACSGPQYKNLVHPSHRPELQAVNTPAKAAAFFSDSTLLTTGWVGQIELTTTNGRDTAEATRAFISLYLAKNGRAYFSIGGDSGIMKGHWRIHDTPGRSYPRVCTAFSNVANGPAPAIKSDLWKCQWPSTILRTHTTTHQLYRGDVLRLERGKTPKTVQSRNNDLSLQQFWNKQGINPLDLTRLIPS